MPCIVLCLCSCLSLYLQCLNVSPLFSDQSVVISNIQPLTTVSLPSLDELWDFFLSRHWSCFENSYILLFSHFFCSYIIWLSSSQLTMGMTQLMMFWSKNTHIFPNKYCSHSLARYFWKIHHGDSACWSSPAVNVAVIYIHTKVGAGKVGCHGNYCWFCFVLEKDFLIWSLNSFFLEREMH